MVLWMGCVGVLSPLIVPTLSSSQQVPEQWREGRWEMTEEGLRAREMTEETCGELVGEMWLDFPAGKAEPLLKNGTPEMDACFRTKVGPRFARDRVDL